MKSSAFVIVAAVLALSACGPIRSDGELRALGLGPQVCNAPGHHCRPVVPGPEGVGARAGAFVESRKRLCSES